MKFLTTVKPGPMPPPAEVARAGNEWLQAALDDGWIECCYAYPHGGGAASARSTRTRSSWTGSSTTRCRPSSTTR